MLDCRIFAVLKDNNNLKSLEIMETEKQIHPSFGNIEISRMNGTNSFYGSELDQDSYITIIISTSELIRDLVGEKFYPEKRLMQLRMTHAQFAEMITSLNCGSGVPCTIEVNNGQWVEKLPVIEKRKDFIARKFKDKIAVLAESLKKSKEFAKSIINKKTLSKDDQYQLNSAFDSVVCEIERNLPYYVQCFQEANDEIVGEAKMEVEQAILHKMTKLGLMALHAS